MHAQEFVTVQIAGDRAGPALRVYRLPRRKASSSAELWAASSVVNSEPGVAAFEVVEGSEYRFEWLGIAGEHRSTTEPQELFEIDDVTGRTGRLRPRLATGTVDAVLLVGDAPSISFSFEVRSRKLDYKSEYRWMLRDVAEHMTELVMQRFAASRMAFDVDEARDAATLYEQFEFLRAALQGDRLREAFARIMLTPHVSWETHSELVSTSRGLKATAASLRHLARGSGLRVPVGHIRELNSVPEKVLSSRTEQSVDTPPNQFVLYALEHWQGLLWRLADALATKGDSPLVLRARREVRALLEHLAELLDAPLFRGVGRLNQFPSGNQVLQKREGYRDFYRIFIEVELAAMLTWHKQDARYLAGQRDVAELYELWTFLQVGAIVGELIGTPFLLAPLLQASPDGLAINLHSGKESVLTGELERAGRKLQVALHYNKTFDRNSAGGASWTRPMRPDITLSFIPSDSLTYPSEPTHVHFDAKYRVQALEEIFGAQSNALISEPSSEVHTSTVRRDDLLKMHAYRDAIRRTAGAYVLYPGTGDEPENFREYHELLPGLGAFVLRPTQEGIPSGAHAVRAFIDGVLDQAASRFSQHERSTFWQTEVYGPERLTGWYDEPLSQASVLLGYVKSQEHWEWVRQTRTYNVRTPPRVGGVPRDAALLQSQLLLLYCPVTGDLELFRIVGEAEIVSAEAMSRSGYPEPQGSYWCVQVSRLAHRNWLLDLSAEALDKFVTAMSGLRGTPTLVNWGTVRSLKRSVAE